MAWYRILTGMDFPGPDGAERRAEVGEARDDVPEASLPWLLADGHISPATAPEPADTPAPAADSSTNSPAEAAPAEPASVEPIAQGG